jgi:phage regulator Rha-like protein
MKRRTYKSFTELKTYKKMDELINKSKVKVEAYERNYKEYLETLKNENSSLRHQMR